MHKRLRLLLLITFVFVVNSFHKTFANNCNTFDKLKRVFNVGENVFFENKAKSYLKFDSQYKRIFDRQFSFDELFGGKNEIFASYPSLERYSQPMRPPETLFNNLVPIGANNSFNWVETAFTFTFDECDPISRSEDFCRDIREADGLVFVFGKRKKDLKYGYVAYRVSDEDQLIRTGNEPLVWGLRGSGLFSDDFWVEIPGYKNSQLLFPASVFVQSRNELIVVMEDQTRFQNNRYLMSRRLEDDGQWSPQWTQLPNPDIKSMFDINGRVFGLNESGTFEFIWSADNAINFVPISNIKELFNCYENSTVGQPLPSPLIVPTTTTTSATTSTTTTTTTVSLINNSSSANPSSVETLLEAEEETNEINTNPNTDNEEVKEKTALPEVEVLEPENSSLPEQVSNQRLEEEPESETNWSIVFIVAIVALIAAVVIAVILIVRNKSRSRSLYLNSKTEETKSLEPLNNNDKKDVEPKDSNV